MADDLDLDTAGEEEPDKGGSLKWIIIGVLGVVLLVGAILGTLYFAGILGGGEEPPVAEKGDGKAVEKTTAAPKGPMLYLPMDPPFVVNFGADADMRFMQLTLQAADHDPAVLERVKEHAPAIRNSLVMLFSSQSPEALNTREGKEKLRQEALKEVRRVLGELTGQAKLENIYFTSFVMQ
ncbi:flagellar basal body-associated FliL family protein [Thiohalobacter sp. IOR34]|uniref:flagellar basal body-associated FliL family protein n=1 Tax=Thiohalobacter sp. IOR34 TaxID=3057176 RepID=UPI0025B1E587|nr:flagellar basal body-associated FliL family protein [Thiohalobacter sp. IOR34]WJW74568.1 flagellar basal body-associated FliL family protein [Thiohalobacter sp. IOR34]